MFGAVRPVNATSLNTPTPIPIPDPTTSRSPTPTLCALPSPPVSSDAFENRLISKRYVALVAGELEGSGAIVTPLSGKVT